MSADTRQKLSATTVALHWIVGLGMIILMIVGFYMHETKSFNLYPLHKSFGAIVFIFVLIRVFWRIKQGWLEHVGQYAPWEVNLSKIVLWVLIIGTVLFPLSGMIMSFFGGHGVALFGLELIAPNIGAEGKPVPLNGALAGMGSNVHGILLPVMVIAILLHIAGAYKHHFVDKDGTMKRILGKQVD